MHSELDFQGNTKVYDFVFSRDVTLNLGHINLSSDGDDFYIMVRRSFENVDNLDNELLYSELPENQEKIYIKENSNDTIKNKLEFYQSYSEIEYNDIMRDREGKKGTKHLFTAEVLHYQESIDEGYAFALLMRDGDSEKIYQTYFLTLPDQRLIEGDNVIIFGVLAGIDSYETVGGALKTTPLITVDKVDITD